MPTLPTGIQELKVSPPTLSHELPAGLIMAIVTIPSGLAGGVLARVNPVYGVYSMVIGTPIAAVFTAEAVMNVDNTSAAALGAANAGNFGTDYLVRSATAWKYIYVQASEEALYPAADVDSAGQQLDGASDRYLLTFPKGQNCRP